MSELFFKVTRPYIITYLLEVQFYLWFIKTKYVILYLLIGNNMVCLTPNSNVKYSL